MKLQKQPNRWSCLPTAFAMALDVPVEELIVKIRHDGSDFLDNLGAINNELSTPYNRKSFHIQELVNVSYEYFNSLCVPFEANPTSVISPNLILIQVKKILDLAVSAQAIKLTDLVQVNQLLNQLGDEGVYEVIFPEGNEQRIQKILNNHIGVIIGETLSGKPHAVAWDTIQIYDPNGTNYPIEEFIIDTFWLIHPFNSNRFKTPILSNPDL